MTQPVDMSEAGKDVLGMKWFAISFFGILAFICLLIYGAYLPWVSSLSSDAIAEGDAYFQRALFLKEHQSSNEDIEKLNQKIISIHRFSEIYWIWMRHPDGNQRFDPRYPLHQEVLRTLKQVEPDITSLDQFVLEMISKDDLKDTFGFLIDRFLKRMETTKNRLQAIDGKPLTHEYFIEQYYHGFGTTDIPELLTQTKKIYGLYSIEDCFDNAMAEYIDAAGYDRLSPTPRLRMANLYRDRAWPEFAMMEYLRAIKLDRDGPEGKTAFEEIRKYVGKHPEAEFHLALAYILYGDYQTAGNYLQTFIDHAPTNVRAPKASEVLGHLRAGNDLFLKSYIRDEIWI